MVEKNCIGFVETQITETNINVTEIHIIDAYQGMGIGSRIIKDIIDKAKQLNLGVTLGCFKENTGAKRLYEKLGFALTKESDTHFCFEI